MAYCRNCGEEDYVCRQSPCTNCECFQHQLDFTFFWCQIAIAMIATRLQLVYGLAIDEEFSRKLFHCYSPSARLKVIVRVIESPSVDCE